MTSANPHDIRVADRRRAVDRAWTEKLKESIKELGIITPIVVSPDLTLIAGLHRLTAARELGLETIPVCVLRLDDLHRELAEIDENLIRNELTVLERGEHLARRKVIYEALHPETRAKVAGALASNKKQGNATPDSGAASFVSDTASKTNRGSSTVREEIQIATNLSPAVKEQIRGLELADSKTDLVHLARMSPIEQKDAVERIASGECKDVRAAIAMRNTEGRRVVTLSESVNGRFPVIYADPPWSYSNTGLTGSAAGQYPTMSTDDICSMPVADKSTSNAVLLLWATWPMLEDALRVIRSWGFSYKTGAPWKKNNHVGGFYFLGITEPLLVATRGSALPKTAPVGFFDYPRTAHSKKPLEMYDTIERMYEGPYLELFARNKRDGWSSFGNEIDEDGK